MTDPTVLRTLVPINSLATAHFEELVEAVTFEEKSKGLVLFKLGATDNDTLYVLQGRVELIAGGSHEGRVITGGTEQGKYPLAQLKPRQFTGKTKTDALIARMPSDLLDRLLTWDQVTGEYEVTELADAEDAEWIMQVLRNRAFQLLPASNINQLFERLEPVALRAGEIVIKQGDVGDYFYIIKEGRCRVSRKAERSGQLAVLGELSEGDSFGEEALLSGAPRNATIVMATEGIVMRLSKRDFEELLQQPLVRWVNGSEVKTMIKNGAQLVDVRLEDEHRHSAIKSSINLPLYLLRLKAAALDPGRSYVLYCETGNRSSAAAFLLSERGLDVYVLQGGLAALRAARRESASAT